VASGGGKRFRPFVVYNPCAWERSEPVTVTLYDTDMEPGRIVARDETGTQHPTLFLGRGHDWGHDKITVLFMAQNVPALGYRTFVLCEGAPDADVPLVRMSPGENFETPFLRLAYDRFQCGFREASDKRSGARFTDPFEVPLGAWEYTVERPRGMTAWVLGEEVDTPLVLRASSFSVLGVARNQGTNVAGGAALAYRIDQTLECPGTHSTVRVSTLIHGLAPRIDVTAEVDWREIGDARRGIPGLCVRFPLSFSSLDMTARYEVPFGSVERDLFGREEVPTLRYAHLAAVATTEESLTVPCGFTLLQDSKSGTRWTPTTCACGSSVSLRPGPDARGQPADRALRDGLPRPGSGPRHARAARRGLEPPANRVPREPAKRR
jgi:hypothetical protein